MHTAPKQLLTLATAALLATACHHNNMPDGVMDSQQMVDFLSEAYLLEGDYAIESQFQYQSNSTTAMQAYDSLLSVQGLTQVEVEKSLEYYSYHLEEYKAIMDSVVARLEVVYTKDNPTPVAD